MWEKQIMTQIKSFNSTVCWKYAERKLHFEHIFIFLLFPTTDCTKTNGFSRSTAVHKLVQWLCGTQFINMHVKECSRLTFRKMYLSLSASWNDYTVNFRTTMSQAWKALLWPVNHAIYMQVMLLILIGANETHHIKSVTQVLKVHLRPSRPNECIESLVCLQLACLNLFHQFNDGKLSHLSNNKIKWAIN